MGTKLNFQPDFQIAKTNMLGARDVLYTEWGLMSTVEQNTWKLNKQFTKDEDGFPTFLDYFLREFKTSNSNITTYVTITLGAGTGKTWSDKASRTWSVA